jgi:hypothetical protein
LATLPDFENMQTYQVSILDPKAARLLQYLADMDLISIKPLPDGFQAIVERLRDKAAGSAPSLDEITKEVEAVRAKR